MNVWDKLSSKYDKLWVQKYSLTPTRKRVCEIIQRLKQSDNFSLLDAGCATGQFVNDMLKLCPNAKYVGIDKSVEMIALANEKKLDAEFITLNSEDMNFEAESFDFVVCCHSFPYYSDKKTVVKKIKEILKRDGYAVFVQASINNLYDKIVLWGVEKTAEDAQYLSKEDFKKLFADDFDVAEEFVVKEKFFMPTLAGFVLRVKK